MSGIAGAFWLDGRPADGELVGRMTAAMAYRGPDGIHCEVDGPAALGHCQLCTTPESLRERQPLWDASRMYCLAMDGRVDNRSDLMADLRGRGAVLRDDTDAELVLQAYVTWGEECCRRVIGDFAFVVWDRRERRLFCGRDHLGIKPFYWWSDGRKFLWASELHCLFEDGAVPRVVNEGMVAEYLAFDISTAEETLWEGVRSLLPGHYGVASESGFRVRRYWDAAESPEVRHGSDEQYAEHFRDLFFRAVKERLRAAGPVRADLSGGVDSSAVVCAATALGAEFGAVSLVYPGLPCDESEFIEPVVAATGCAHEAIRWEQGDLGWLRESARRYQSFPEFPNMRMHEAVYQRMRAAGSRVLLTGEGGDDWFRGSEVVRRTLAGRLWGLVRDPRRIGAAVRRRWGTEVPRWVRREFAVRVGLAERVKRRGWALTYHIADIAERAAAFHGVELRHPFCDRRLMEFAFGVPREQLWRDGLSKVVVRNGMRGLMPETVRMRRSKADFGFPMVSGCCRMLGERGFDARRNVVAHGWVDGRVLDGMYCEVRREIAEGRRDNFFRIWPLWMATGMEVWYGEAAEGIRESDAYVLRAC